MLTASTVVASGSPWPVLGGSLFVLYIVGTPVWLVYLRDPIIGRVRHRWRFCPHCHRKIQASAHHCRRCHQLVTPLEHRGEEHHNHPTGVRWVDYDDLAGKASLSAHDLRHVRFGDAPSGYDFTAVHACMGRLADEMDAGRPIDALLDRAEFPRDPVAGYPTYPVDECIERLRAQVAAGDTGRAWTVPRRRPATISPQEVRNAHKSFRERPFGYPEGDVGSVLNRIASAIEADRDITPILEHVHLSPTVIGFRQRDVKRFLRRLRENEAVRGR